MSYQYDQYLTNHKSNVKKGFDWIRNNLPELMNQEFDLEHQNLHYWQYWILINDNPEEGEILIEMPYNYILEMICDWWAFGWSKGNLNEIFPWYEQRKNYIKLHPNSRKILESILGQIKNKLEDPK